MNDTSPLPPAENARAHRDPVDAEGRARGVTFYRGERGETRQVSVGNDVILLWLMCLNRNSIFVGICSLMSVLVLALVLRIILGKALNVIALV